MGILGQNLASGAGTGRSAGVRGITAITTTLGTGVWGEALQTDGDNVGVFGYSASVLGAGVQGWASATTGDNNGVYGRTDSNAGTGVYGEATATSAASASAFPVGVYGKLMSSAGAAGLFDTNSSGDILVGRAGSSPVKVFRVDSTGKGFFNGSTQVGGADFAESVAVKNAKSDYVPGDLIAIDPTGTRRFTKSSAAYSTLVAGIYSTKPGVLASPHAIDDVRIEGEEIPLAVVGIVPCKVTNENGTIKAGDLLVSSSREGYAMKGTDRSRMNGAVIGKALQDMKSASGVIEVLVSLQ
jgi:trimeric autotransporter adhesin